MIPTIGWIESFGVSQLARMHKPGTQAKLINSCMAMLWIARKLPLMKDRSRCKDGFQPKTEFRFIEMHARYRSFDPENNVRRIAGGAPQSGH